MSPHNIDETKAIPVTAEEATCVSPQRGWFLGDDGVFARSRILADETAVSQTRFMGSLSILPIEILHQILAQVDVCTLIHFHNLNRGTMAAVNSMLFFPLVASFPRALGAMALLENNTVTLPTLAACIQSTKCTHCDRFGDLIYTITAQRVCFPCFCREKCTLFCPELRSYSTLSEEQLRHVPRVRSVPGRFGLFNRVASREELLDRQLLMSAEAEHNPGGQAPPAAEIVGGFDPVGYMATIPAPYFESKMGRWEMCVCCLACAGDTRYTRMGMREHIAEHGGFIKLESGRFAHTSSSPTRKAPPWRLWRPSEQAADFAKPIRNWEASQWSRLRFSIPSASE